MLHVTFYSLTGDFKSVRQESFNTEAEALAAAKAHAEPAGYTNVKIVLDTDGFTLRFTARTPGGRAGRNVAIGDFE